MEAVLEVIPQDPYLEAIKKHFRDMDMIISEIDPYISSKKLIDFINRLVESPGLHHYNFIQKAWYREHAWYLNEHISDPEKRKIPDEVIMDWLTGPQQVKHHREYAEAYIIGKNVSEKNQRWTYAFLKRLSDEVDMSDKYCVLKS